MPLTENDLLDLTARTDEHLGRSGHERVSRQADGSPDASPRPGEGLRPRAGRAAQQDLAVRLPGRARQGLQGRELVRPEGDDRARLLEDVPDRAARARRDPGGCAGALPRRGVLGEAQAAPLLAGVRAMSRRLLARRRRSPHPSRRSSPGRRGGAPATATRCFWQVYDRVCAGVGPQGRVGQARPSRWGCPCVGRLRNDLRRHNLYDTNVAPAENPPPVPPFEARLHTSRSPDGTYNDLDEPAMGRAGTRFGRNVPFERTSRSPSRGSSSRTRARSAAP